jgi:hypothetical protein
LETYAVDRQDNQNQNLSALAIVGAALLYVAAAASFVSNHCGRGNRDKQLPIGGLVLLPLPAIALLSFLVVILGGVLIRSKNLRDVELRIRRLASDEHPRSHVEADDTLFGRRGDWRFRVLNTFSYAGTLVIVWTVAVVSLVLAWSEANGFWTVALVLLASVVYGAVLSLRVERHSDLNR